MNSADFKPLVMSEADVDRILTLDMARAAVADAFICHANGQFTQPPKPYIRPCGREGEYDGGRYIAMPVFAGPPVDMVGIKWIGSLPKNVDRGLPRASGILVLNDLITAIPLAVMECGILSARRTAAVAGLSVELLAPRGSLRVAMVGAGPVAHEVVNNLARFVDGIDGICVCDLRPERAQKLRDVIVTRTPFKASTVPTPEECIRGSNVIIAATTGSKSYIKLDWLSSPFLLIPLSLDDCEPEVLLSAKAVICDDWIQSNREEKLLHKLTQAGKFAHQDLYAELSQIVTGRLPIPEESGTYVNLMGMGIEDIAVAARVFRAATNGF